jgi:hypothetical protein
VLVVEFQEQIERVSIAVGGCVETAEVMVGVTEAVPGPRLPRPVAKFLSEIQGLLAPAQRRRMRTSSRNPIAWSSAVTYCC